MKKQLEKLFLQYHREVYSYLYSLSHDAALSEDLASEVFVEVVKSLVTFQAKSDIKTWIFSIARHKWFHHLRSKNRTIQTEQFNDFLKSVEKSPEDVCYQQQLKQKAEELLQNEPERVRIILKMRLEGFSFYEIGQAVGVLEGSARVMEFRAKARIKEQLEKEGFEYE